MPKTPKKRGRPTTVQRPNIYESEIYKLLRSHLPMAFIAADGKIDTMKLADALNYRRMSIYRWFNGANMSVSAVNALSNISAMGKCDRKGILTKEKLLPFVGL